VFNKKYTALIIIGLLADQITKYLAELHLSFYAPIRLIPKALTLQLVHNYGAAYGILQNQRVLLLSISIFVLIFCYIFRNKIATTKYSRLGLSFLFIGTLGNFIDRLVIGYVIDFIYIYIVPVFNLADVCIDIGIVFLIIDIFFPKKKVDTIIESADNSDIP
jgi:signal peptidase II